MDNNKIHQDKIALLSRLIKENHITKEDALLLLSEEGNKEAQEVIAPNTPPYIDYNDWLNNQLLVKKTSGSFGQYIPPTYWSGGLTLTNTTGGDTTTTFNTTTL